MDYDQIDKILLSFGLGKHEISEGTNYTYARGNRHKIVLERLKPLANGGARGFLYAVVLGEYSNKCSKNGHINVKNIKSPAELNSIIERVISHLNNTWQ